MADRLWSEFADTDERLVVVTHGGFIKDLVSVLVAGGPLSPGIISSRNTSITSLSFVEGQIVVGYMNRIDHLPAESVT